MNVLQCIIKCQDSHLSQGQRLCAAIESDLGLTSTRARVRVWLLHPSRGLTQTARNNHSKFGANVEMKEGLACSWLQRSLQCIRNQPAHVRWGDQ